MTRKNLATLLLTAALAAPVWAGNTIPNTFAPIPPLPESNHAVNCTTVFGAQSISPNQGFVVPRQMVLPDSPSYKAAVRERERMVRERRARQGR